MFHSAHFKWNHFQDGIILFNVRWYCRYSLSYRNLEEMMAERGLCVEHSIIHVSVANRKAQDLRNSGTDSTENHG